MLRKLSHIILLVLLFISTMGMTVSKHYCNDKFVSVKIFSEAKSCCGESDCCHNENQLYKVQDEFSATSIQDIPELAEIDLLGQEQLSFDLSIKLDDRIDRYQIFDSPPPLKIQKLLSLKQTYLL